MIDRNYRDPVHPLTPNVMVTQSTLTCEILPVQGRMTIMNRGTHSPTTLKRVVSDNTAAAVLGAAYTDAGIKGVASKNQYGYVVTVTGAAAAGSSTIDKALFGDLTGNYAQMTMQLPAIAHGGSYIVKQYNPALAAFDGQADIKVDDQGVYCKTKAYTYNDLLDGYSLLLTDSTEAVKVMIYNAEGYIDGASQPISVVTVNNNVQFA